MGIELPNPGRVFLPKVPKELESTPALADYLNKVTAAIEEGLRRGFDNTLHIATAINSGTSGTFAISSGGSIVVTSGVVINITS